LDAEAACFTAKQPPAGLRFAFVVSPQGGAQADGSQSGGGAVLVQTAQLEKTEVMMTQLRLACGGLAPRSTEKPLIGSVPGDPGRSEIGCW
jgi:hypothetical protein